MSTSTDIATIRALKANVETLSELNINQARTIEEQQAQIEHLKSEHEKWDALASRENERLQAQVEELEAAIERLGSSEAMTMPFAINADSNEGWELRERISYARAALQENEL